MLSILHSDFSPYRYVPTKIDASVSHTVLITDRGLFYGFGLGRNGELGYEAGFDMYRASRLKLPVPEIKDKQNCQVALGAKHTLILADGQVYAMGEKADGRLGNLHGPGTVTFPIECKIAYITCGTDYSIALTDDGYSLFIWGLAPFGEGVWGKVGVIPTPKLFHIYGDEKQETKRRVLQIVCGSRHCIALDEHGFMYSWGSSDNGRLGHGKVGDSLIPQLIAASVCSPEQRIVQVAAGDSHSMALNKEGHVFSWGSGSYGRLGSGSESDIYTPKIIEGLQKVISISCNAFHSLAVSEPIAQQGVTFATLWVWGGGKYGKLGLGERWGEANALSPKPVILEGGSQGPLVIRAVCGLNHTVAITRQGNVYAWGYTDSLRCGIESEKPCFFSPVCIDSLTSVGMYQNWVDKKESKGNRFFRARQVATGEAHSLALTSEKTVLSWGSNTYGQLGISNQGVKQDFTGRPTIVNFGVSGKLQVQKIACGSYHSLALVQGSVFAWGRNNCGQLGIGETQDCIVPTLIKALQGTMVSKIAAGHMNSAAIEHEELTSAKTETIQQGALRAVNKIYVWGSNSHGQLGLGKGSKVENQLIPAVLRMPRKFNFYDVDIALGFYHTLILGKNYDPDITKAGCVRQSAVYACGKGKHGELGLSSVANQKVERPTRISHWGKETPKAMKERLKREELKAKADAEKLKSRSRGCFSLFEGASPPATIKEKGQLLGGDSKKKTKEEKEQAPLIKLIAASEQASMAVTYDDHIERVYGWGSMPGIFENVSVPQPLDAFEQDMLKEELRSEAIWLFKIRRISLGKRHCTLLAEYNRERHNNVVFTWGETKYGKLGIGNVPDFLDEKKQKKDSAKKGVMPGSVEMDDDDGRSRTSVIPPTLIPALSDASITDISGYADHTLAASDITGRIFAFGYGDSGRLGLYDVKSDSYQSVHEPKPLPMFRDPRTKDLTSILEGEERISASGDVLLERLLDEAVDVAQKEGQEIRIAVGDSEGGETIEEDAPVVEEEEERAVPEHEFRKKYLGVLKEIEVLTAERQTLFAPYVAALKELQREKDLVDLAFAKRSQEALSSKSRSYYLTLLKENKSKDKGRTARGQNGSTCDGCGKLITGKQFQCVKCQKTNVKHDYCQDCERAFRKGSVNVYPAASSISRKLTDHQFEETRLQVEDQKRIPDGELSSLEKLISRLYLRPCLMLRLFNMVKEKIHRKGMSLVLDEKTQAKRTPEQIHKEAKQARNEIEAMKADFCDLLFAVYDPYRPTDFRLLKLFLQLMLNEHASSTTQVDSILAPNSLEWAVLLRTFLSGSLRRTLGDTLGNILEEVQKFDGEFPTVVFETWVLEGRKKEKEKTLRVRNAWINIRKQANKIFGLIVDKTNPHFPKIFSAIYDVIELLYDALNRAAHPTHPILGSRIIDILAEVMLADQQYQHEKADIFRSTNFGEKENKLESKTIAAHMDSMRLAMITLKGEKYLDEALLVRWNIDVSKFQSLENPYPRKFHAKIDFDKMKEEESQISEHGLMQRHEILRSLKIFELEIRIQQGTRELTDPLAEAKYDTAKDVNMQQLYQDFLRARSKYERRLTVLKPSIAKFLEESWSPLWGGQLQTRVFQDYENMSNVTRIDPFHVDFNSPTFKCYQCGVVHPKFESEIEEKKTETETKGETREERITTSECKDLLKVLSSVSFKKVIYTLSAEATWKEIWDMMGQERKKAMSAGNYEKGHIFENAANILRRLKKIKKDSDRPTLLYLGDESTVPVSKGELIDLEPLLEALQRWESSMQGERRLALHRIGILKNINAEIKEETENLRNEIARYKTTFSNIIQGKKRTDLVGIAATDSRNHVTLPKFKIEHLVPKLKQFQPIQVYKARGASKRFSYNQLVKRGLLKQVSDDPRRFAEPCCWCIPCCFCWFTTFANSWFNICMGRRVQVNAKFLSRLYFVFNSTDYADIVQLQLIYRHSFGGFHDTDLLTTSRLYLSQLSGPPELCKCHRIEYDPTGDHVPIRGKQTYEFEQRKLYLELQNFARPHGETLDRLHQSPTVLVSPSMGEGEGGLPPIGMSEGVFAHELDV